jgi:uracil-DNA glycosylase
VTTSRLIEPIDTLVDRLSTDWRAEVEAWRQSTAGRELIRQVDARVVEGACVYPAQVFRALELTPLARTRVVILGQDPYHGEGQAEGLAFSVSPGVRPPPSLRNIFKELQRDLGVLPTPHGHLGGWARQGVLLLNSSLTVEDSAPGSHAKWGWQQLTDRLICAAARHPEPKVFLLWGAHAQAKEGLIRGAAGAHLVLRSNHPSPLAANRPPIPFIGCGHFGEAARFVARTGSPASALVWSLALLDECLARELTVGGLP